MGIEIDEAVLARVQREDLIGWRVPCVVRREERSIRVDPGGVDKLDSHVLGQRCRNHELFYVLYRNAAQGRSFGFSDGILCAWVIAVLRIGPAHFQKIVPARKWERGKPPPRADDEVGGIQEPL